MSSESSAMIRVLVVEDSPAMRAILVRTLTRDPQLRVVGTAPDPFVAREKIVSLKPDVITLDIELPRMDGLSFLRRLMEYHPLPVVVFSSFTPRGGKLALEALDVGGVDVVCKPDSVEGVQNSSIELIDKIKAAAAARLNRALPGKRAKREREKSVRVCEGQRRVVAVGASTGGPQVLQVILGLMPARGPGMVVVQHMPKEYTKSFAKSLDSLCDLKVRVAVDGEPVTSGTVLLSPGDRHMTVRRCGAGLSVALREGPLVNRHRPSIDVLFKSVGESVGASAIGVLLTGMGVDGADGLALIKRRGGTTIVQSEETCVVFGMPKEARDRGDAQFVVGPEEIPKKIAELCEGR